MRAERSRLAQVVIAYHEKFGRHVPEYALRIHAAKDLAEMLKVSIATNVPIVETGSDRCLSMGFGPHGCIVRARVAPKKRSDGEWLQ